MLVVQAVGKALREREQALLTVSALENELRTKRRGISSLEESGQQVGPPGRHLSTQASSQIVAICLVRGPGMDADKEGPFGGGKRCCMCSPEHSGELLQPSRRHACSHARQQQSCMTRSVAHLPGRPALS